MNSKVRWLSKLEGFQGIVIHPDDVRNGWAYGRGIMGHLSLKGLTRAFNSFSEGWMGRLKKERRGKFIFRFTDGSSEASWNTRGDQILMKDASKSSLIQVVGSPRFPQGHFELLHKMHPSTFAMIPAAAMAIRVMDLEEVEVKHRRELPEAFDWAHQFTDPLTPGLVKLNRHDIGEKLGKILKALRGTKQMAFWGDVPLSYSVNTDNERALEEVPDDGRLLDVIFTTGFGKENLKSIK